jgi:muramidase (phage lysozyme)
MDSGHAVWWKTPRWIRDLGLCIRRHESINAGHYKADNGTSTASGAYQMIQATWDGNARYARWKGHYVARPYVGKPASSAPQWVQDVVFIHSIERGGIKAWHGTWCPGT